MVYIPQQWLNNNTSAPYGPINDTRLNYIEAGIQAGHVTADAAIPKSVGTTKGDVMAYTGSAWARLAVGSDGQFLVSDSTQTVGVKWSTVSTSGAILAALVDAKGDLIVATANDTVARQAVGSNGQVLTADTSASTGVRWKSPPQVNVKTAPYNAVGDGVADDTTALTSAITDAAGKELYIPEGTYKFTSALTLTDTSVRGAGRGTILKPTALGAGVAAITMTGTGGGLDTSIRDLVLQGPGAYSLGTKTANVDGLKFTSSITPKIDNVRVEQFDSGIVFANSTGHIYARELECTNNYYGIYCTVNNFDYTIVDSLINGNSFANIATPADQGFEGLVMRNVHCGFAPYGIYQEATPSNQGQKLFLQDCILDYVRFESIGNGAIVSDAQRDASNWSLAADVLITLPGFSWDTATYKIGARSQAFAIDVGRNDRTFRIVSQGAHPFTAGTTNVMRVKFGGGSTSTVELGHNASLVSHVQVDNNFTVIRAGQSPPLERFDGTYYRHLLGKNSVEIITGPGTPEGNVTAPVSSLYLRDDGSTGTAIYRKETGSGNTGWIASAGLVGGLVPTSQLGTGTPNGTLFLRDDQTYARPGAVVGVPQKSSNYTFVLTDAGQLVVATAAGITFNVPTNASVAFPLGTTISVGNDAAGTLTIAAVTPGTTTINNSSNTFTLKQWGYGTLIKRATDMWVLSGDVG